MLFLAGTGFACEIVERVTYSNGVTVLMCEENDVIGYCAEEDLQNAMTSLRNPNVYVVRKETLKKKKGKFRSKTYYAQQNVQMGANLINTIADTARIITSSMGVSW